MQILPADGGGAVTIHITAMACELVAAFLLLDVPFSAIKA